MIELQVTTIWYGKTLNYFVILLYFNRHVHVHLLFVQGSIRNEGRNRGFRKKVKKFHLLNKYGENSFHSAPMISKYIQLLEKKTTCRIFHYT